MQSMKIYGATALCLTLSTLALPSFAEEAATQPATEAAEVQAEAPATAEEAMPQDPMAGLELPEFSNEDISYTIGYTIGSDMNKRNAGFDAEQLIEGLRAGLGGDESRLTEQQMSQAMFMFQMQMQQKMMQQMQQNLTDSKAFLDENAKKEGVKVTDSGLQYRVIKQGDGATPTAEDVVQANYKGTLIDGKEFDSSDEGEPVSFPVGRVIPGWVEALQMMKVGDKWELVIPPDLAYGEYGNQDGSIGPNQVLIFEIELVGIE